MPISYREPRRRRRNLPKIPHLYAYKKADEKMDALRIGLDPLSMALLRELSIFERVQEATWFSVLAHRLLTEPDLGKSIQEYGATKYPNLPDTPKIYIFRNYTIPHALKLAIENCATTLRSQWFEDKRGVTGPWLRVALAYCAFAERQWPLERFTPGLQSIIP